MVLSYHLQHPSLYSSEALQGGVSMLHEFIAKGVSPPQMRRQMRKHVDSGRRTTRVVGTPESRGAYAAPVPWTMTAGDVIRGGPANYVANILEWAASIDKNLLEAGLLHSTKKA